ncbi:GNAT family N-acetyltransferase [Fodinibius salsisoli]|uniref:GNAT family N-acetyltransferase n=1 Tax=Fodinibius salsisoli TaxID=2820877 RepID=A0ABT3PK88_9BACT|nr:GNAT family N-acetyltransferase [Fodinibius salsisoli]MCW9706317.1 GNAT family N-acetyltransferase [Fodinibius salsisoli]
MPQQISTDIPNCHLQFAQEEDIPLILGFIRSLAEYEKMADEVVATEKLLKEKLFGEQQYAEVLLAFYDEEAVGFALFFHSFSTFEGRPGIYLEDLFVKPEFRGKGIGTALLKSLAQLTIERDCARLEWSVLNWNTPAIDFYDSLDAKPLDEWTTYRLTGEALQKLASF